VSSPEPATPTPLPGSAARDQQQLACTGGLSVGGTPIQTFTVGIGGQLVRVDLALCSPSKNARIDVTASTSGSNAQSTTASLKIPHDWSDCAWYEFDFGHPLSAVAGAVVQLKVTSPNHKSALWAFDGESAGDPYPAGQGQWRGQTINDFAFQTYMQ
jgi:hypothetical protein